jgi:adenosylmethionine-8-amino-7-oxononanoate aminotransferase
MANLDIIESESLLDRAKGIGERLGKSLADLVDGEHVVGTRGTMGIWAIELAPHIDSATLRNALLNFGVIARPVGPTVLAYCPPLVITDAQMDRCVDGTRNALDVVTGRT